MPRAFLIKKKRAAADAVNLSTLSAEGGDSNSGSPSPSMENKENLEDVSRVEGTGSGCKGERGRENPRGADKEAHMEYSSSGEESQASTPQVPDVSIRTAAISESGSPTPHESAMHSEDSGVQQFPTDLSLKSSSSPAQFRAHHHHHPSVSSPSPPPPSHRLPHPYHRGQDISPPSPHRLPHPYHRPATSSSPPSSSHLRRSSESSNRCDEGRCSSSPQHVVQPTLPPLPKPCKRPSDFSTEFLLSHHPAHKRVYSPPTTASLSTPAYPSHRFSSSSSSSSPACVSSSSPTDAMNEKRHRFENESSDKTEHEHAPIIPSPSKYPHHLHNHHHHHHATPCLSVSTWLEDHHPASAVLASAYQMCRSRAEEGRVSANHMYRSSREDRVSASSSADLHSPVGISGRVSGVSSVGGADSTHCFPSPLGLRRDDGPSAFRRSDGRQPRDFSPRKRDAHITSSSSSSASASFKGASPQMVSPRSSGQTSPSDRRVPSTSPRDSVFASPHELLTSRGLLSEVRRGTSTSPAHSERTSSGCGSPADSPEGSPDLPPPRYPLDLPWGHPASSSSSSTSASSPFLPYGLTGPAQHPFLPMGLRYLPALPLPPVSSKPDPSLPFAASSYPKALSDGMASAFRSTRPPFVHPATAAYYSSLKAGSMPAYPFGFPSPPGREGVMLEKPSQQDIEAVDQAGLEMLRALRKGAFDPLKAFPTPPPPPPSSMLQHPHGVSPVNLLSPRPSPGSLSSSSSSSPSAAAAAMLGARSPEGVSPGGLDPRAVKGRGGKDCEPVRYQCEACSKSYSTFSGLSKHKQFHCSAQVKKEFRCQYCDKSYVSLGALKMHIRTHTLPCKCSVCGKAFSRPWLLQGHLRTHTGEKPFSCQHCARAFADRSNLRAHLQTHSDVKKYSCRHCAKTFSRMSLLLKHEDGCCANAV